MSDTLDQISTRAPARKDEHGSAALRIGAPHIVIRGETSTLIETPNPIAKIDWLAFTFTPPEVAKDNPVSWLLPQLFEVFNLPPVQCHSKNDKGWNGYDIRVNIGETSQYGLIAFGGEAQRGTVHVELSAMACAHVADWESTKQWGESIGARITRVDLAHDDHQGAAVSIATARAWYEAGEFTTNGRPPKAKLIDDMESGEGKTFYVGKRANGKLLRIYEKGKQLGDPSSPWVRAELELRGKSRVIPWDVLTSPATYLAAGYPCLAYLSAVQNKIRTISKAVQITLDSMLHYLRTAGGKSINVLMQANGGDAFGLINAIKRDGIPRRLVNYADFLPQVLDDGGIYAG